MATRFAADRFVYVFSPDRRLTSGAGTVLDVFIDQPCTTPATIAAPDGTPIPGARVSVGADSLLPEFLDLQDHTVLYVRTPNATGPGSPIVAVTPDVVTALVGPQIGPAVDAYLAANPPTGGGSGPADVLVDLGPRSGDVTLDERAGTLFAVTAEGDLTVATANPRPGTITLVITHAGAGRKVTWPSDVLWASGAPVLSATDGAVDVVTLLRAGDLHLGFLSGAGYLPSLPSEETPGVTDTFTRADGTGLGSAETGQAWVVVTGSWGITGGQAWVEDKFDGALALIDTGFTGMAAEVRVSGLGGGLWPSLLARASADGQTFYRVEIDGDGGGFSLLRNVNGAGGIVASGTGIVPGLLGLSAVEVEGGVRVLVTMDGATILDYADTALTPPAGTYAGLRLGAAGWPTNTIRFDDFSVVPA